MTQGRKRKKRRIPASGRPKDDDADLVSSGTPRAARPARIDLKAWFLPGAILLVTSLAFVNALTGAFLYDDRVQVLENPTLKSLGNIPRMFVQSVWQFLGGGSDQPLGPYYRPLFNIALVLNYQVFGLKVFGWHVSSLLLHLTATLLVYLLARRWGLTAAVAAAAALFFGLHPIHSESVAWVSALPDPLAAVFILLSVLLYERRYYARGRRLSMVLSLVFALLGMLSKEVAIVLPVFLILREWLDRPAGEQWSAALARMARRTMPFVLIAGFYLVVRYEVLGFLSKPAPNAANIPFWGVLLTIPSILLTYGRLFFVPYPLAFVYGNEYVQSAADPRFWGPVMLAIGAVACVIWLVRSNLIRRTLIWSLLFILPVLNLKSFNPDESLLHDRYLYVPSVGLCLLLALALSWISSQAHAREKMVFGVASLLIGATLFSLTLNQNRNWRSFIVLANHGAKVTPGRPFVYYNLACAYEAQGEDPMAEEEYRRAVQSDPTHVEAHINLGVLLTRQNRYEEALDQLRTAQELAPNHPVMLYAMGNVYMRTGRYKEAIESYGRLVQRKPDHRMAYTNLGLCYESIGDKDQAVANFKKAIKVAPDEDWTNVARKHLATLED
jgi:Tfp pilus assembly protein PilF